MDAMSSDACPVRMVSEGEYSVHTSSEVQTLFCLSFACVFALPRYNGISHDAQRCWIHAWKLSKQLGKTLGSFGHESSSKNTTNIGSNFLGTFRPRSLGALGRNVACNF